jgi:hypothetical protein
MASEHFTEASRSRVAAVVPQQIDQTVGVDEAEPVAFVDRPLELPGADHPRQIQNRPRWRRTRNLVTCRKLVVWEAPRAMDPNARSSSPSGARWEGHVDRSVRRLGADRPEGCRIEMAQCGAVAAREHRGQPATRAGQTPVPYRVHAVMDSMKPTGSDHRPDLAFGETERIKLARGNDAMLAFRELGDGARAVRGAFSGHTNG